MKNIYKLAIVMAHLICASSPLVHAASTSSCNADIYQMALQIKQYGTITSIDGYKVNQVVSTSQVALNTCSTDAYLNHHFICTLRWEMGNWGNTFHCY